MLPSEEPIHGLAGTLQTIAHVRGSPIKCLGAMDLLVREPGGAPNCSINSPSAGTGKLTPDPGSRSQKD